MLQEKVNSAESDTNETRAQLVINEKELHMYTHALSLALSLARLCTRINGVHVGTSVMYRPLALRQTRHGCMAAWFGVDGICCTDVACLH